MKNAMLIMLVGALIGTVAASFIVPPMLSWYTAPGGLPQGASIPALVNIPDVIRYATTRLLWGQLLGAVAGAIAGLLLSAAFSRGRTPVPVAVPPAR
jgi:hypothetical protein